MTKITERIKGKMRQYPKTSLTAAAAAMGVASGYAYADAATIDTSDRPIDPMSKTLNGLDSSFRSVRGTSGINTEWLKVQDDEISRGLQNLPDSLPEKAKLASLRQELHAVIESRSPTSIGEDGQQVLQAMQYDRGDQGTNWEQVRLPMEVTAGTLLIAGAVLSAGAAAIMRWGGFGWIRTSHS